MIIKWSKDAHGRCRQQCPLLPLVHKCCFGYGPYSSSGDSAVALALLQFCRVQMRTQSFGWCVHRLCDVDVVLACAFVLMFTTFLMTV